jgi:hypothetical protein
MRRMSKTFEGSRLSLAVLGLCVLVLIGLLVVR